MLRTSQDPVTSTWTNTKVQLPTTRPRSSATRCGNRIRRSLSRLRSRTGGWSCWCLTNEREMSSTSRVTAMAEPYFPLSTAELLSRPVKYGVKRIPAARVEGELESRLPQIRGGEEQREPGHTRTAARRRRDCAVSPAGGHRPGLAIRPCRRTAKGSIATTPKMPGERDQERPNQEDHGHRPGVRLPEHQLISGPPGVLEARGQQPPTRTRYSERGDVELGRPAGRLRRPAWSVMHLLEEPGFLFEVPIDLAHQAASEQNVPVFAADRLVPPVHLGQPVLHGLHRPNQRLAAHVPGNATGVCFDLDRHGGIDKERHRARSAREYGALLRRGRGGKPQPGAQRRGDTVALRLTPGRGFQRGQLGLIAKAEVDGADGALRSLGLHRCGGW